MASSALWAGRVGHSRRDARGDNSFSYAVTMTLLDLAELESGSLDCWPFFSSTTPWAFSAFRRSHHMRQRDTQLPLSTALRDLVQQSTGSRPSGPIKLVTNLACCGIAFNPVSFYYVMDSATGSKIECVVEEVSNIPWFEQHCYLMLPEDTTQDPHSLRGFGWQQKNFHVSPFIENTPEIKYHWSFAPPTNRIYVKGKVVRHGTPFFHAFLDLRHRRPFTVPNIIRTLIAYPFMTLQVIVLIHYNAAKLWFRNYTFYPYVTPTKTAFLTVVESAAALVMRITGKSL